MNTQSADTDDEERMILDAIEKWLDRDVKPHVLRLEHADEYPREMADQMAELGLFGAMIPTQYGGLGLSATTYAKIIEAISCVWMSLTGIINSHLIMAACVTRVGTEDQKHRWLPKLASGEHVAAIAMTEPGTGSDLQAITTTAVKEGNEYLINGSKTFITNGASADILLLVVKTDPSSRARGVSLLVIETKDLAGYRVGGKLKKLGMKRNDTAELSFSDVRVPQMCRYVI